MIPLKLKIKNFLSHAESSIDFDDFDVALVIGAYDNNVDQSNGSGKSALFEAICWALFGKSRHKRKDGVVKRDCKICTVEFTFKVDDQEYRIVRKRDKTLGESDVIFEQKDGDEYKNISCDTNTATEFKIVQTINVNYEVFLNSVYFKQNDISMFAEAAPGKRKDTIKALLKIEKWDAYQKKANEFRKKLKTQIDEKNKNITSLDVIKEELGLCKKSLTGLKKDIKEQNAEFERVNTDLGSKKLYYQSLYSDMSEGPEVLEQLQKEFQQAKRRRAQILKTTEKNNATIQGKKSETSGVEQKIQLCISQIKMKKGIDLQYERNRLINGRTKEKVLKEKIQDLSKPINLSDHCNLCERKISKSEINTLQKVRQDNLKKANAAHSKIKQALKLAESKLQDKERLVREGTSAELNKSKSELRISRYANEISQCLSENEQMGREIEELRSKNFKENIERLKLKFDKQEAKRLKSEIEELEVKLTNNKKKGDRLNVEYGSKMRTRKELVSKQEEQIILQKEIDKLNGEHAIYDKLKQYFGKEGIQSVIIENVIEELENYANDTLSKICNEPTTLAIKTQRQNENGSWTETFDLEISSDGRTDDFETFSGGEQFRVSLALRLALSKILSKRMGGMIRFLLLDEISSSLDDKGLDMFIDIVKQLGTELKVMVITHDELLKDKFDNIIMVNKSVDGSRVAMH